MIRHFLSSAKRTRTLPSALRSSKQFQNASFLRGFSSAADGSPDVAVQLDYYMSLQFAGVAVALVDDIYRSKGIRNLEFLPTCPVGLEASRVRAHQDAHPGTLATLGSVEQNVFVPTLRADPSLAVTAVAAMFRRSPLCVASLAPLKEGDVIGAHEDTVGLLRRVFPEQKVVASPRGTKTTDLLDGTYAGIQAYATTEAPALRRMLSGRGMDPDALHCRSLEDVVGPVGGGSSGLAPKLGYSQLLFVGNEALESPDRREACSAFLEGTFEGWRRAVRDPNKAIEAVAEAQKMLRLDDEANDHWHPSPSFQREMLEAVNDHVKETFAGDRLGVLHPARWSEATEWLLRDADDAAAVDPMLGLDRTNLWQPPSDLLHGNELGRTILSEARESALEFAAAHGRRPSLAVITVGELKRYEHSGRRLQLYSNASNSWFTKTEAGNANGFDVTEINLDEGSTTTEDLLGEIYRIRDDVDGIQVMWPLPPSIDEAHVFNAVPLSKDVDGIHYASWGSSYHPVTPAGAMELIKEHSVEVKGKHCLVVGRSPIVGAPTAHMLREAGAMVTVAHTDVDPSAFRRLVGQADVLVTCAGSPGAVKADWIKEGAAVINVGTTFCEETDALLSDVEGDVGSRAGRHSPVPGGVGPLSTPMLFRNVVQAAWSQMEDATTWDQDPAKLR